MLRGAFERVASVCSTLGWEETWKWVKALRCQQHPDSSYVIALALHPSITSLETHTGTHTSLQICAETNSHLSGSRLWFYSFSMQNYVSGSGRMKHIGECTCGNQNLKCPQDMNLNPGYDQIFHYSTWCVCVWGGCHSSQYCDNLCRDPEAHIWVFFCVTAFGVAQTIRGLSTWHTQWVLILGMCTPRHISWMWKKSVWARVIFILFFLTHCTWLVTDKQVS